MTMTDTRPVAAPEFTPRLIGRRAHRMVDTDTVVLTCEHIAPDALKRALQSIFGTPRPRVDKKRIVVVRSPAQSMLSPAILPILPIYGLDLFVRSLEIIFTGTQHRHVLVIDHEHCAHLDRRTNHASALELLVETLRGFNGSGYPTSAYLLPPEEQSAAA
jgi:hypothetical protein